MAEPGTGGTRLRDNRTRYDFVLSSHNCSNQNQTQYFNFDNIMLSHLVRKCMGDCEPEGRRDNR
jgi:hypothetical protein